jgi:c-di-GMP-related signal transduction protein
MALGFDYFQGYFFARPTIMRGKRLSSSEIALTRLLGLVMSDADTADIEAAIKEQPIVTMKLMRLINSVATGLQREVSSVRQAVQVLGRRQLLRWLQLMVFSLSAPGSGGGSPVLQLAAVRGKMMELLASKGLGASAEVEDRAFITGIMSLMDAVFGMPIEQILDSLPVAPLVRAALVGREGDLGKLLSLVEAVEQYEIIKVAELLESIPALDLQAINEAQTTALAWGNRVAQERPR